ncbi:hypothetical protein DMB44_04760 [Thermoplasma sp. Kam2015]|uniref:glycerophosphodiester phosphodiesterase n=1 Tax=Thermoplasma sp. Kam2015 TaxID=2094122 RepID=UPI000D92676D|nr:glycerophosphodiester phosphodiesterase [Thermoplasma sp. Kam2015]PYB68356.1 hypothetical protein DMB44_04760 [Thermoplasma sp. Kam2015]
MHFLSKYRFIVVGHRGLPSMRLENTLESFDAAFRAGLPAVELDVQHSSDGVPVVFHDFDLTRLAGRNEKISDLKWEELSKIKLETNARIPRLDEVLSQFKEHNFFIEIKVEKFGQREMKLTEDVAEMIINNDMKEQVVLISFEKQVLKYIHDHYDDMITGLDFESPEEVQYALETDVALPYHGLVDDVFEQISMKQVIPWTVDSQEIAKHLKEIGCKGIITNVGDRMMGLME